MRATVMLGAGDVRIETAPDARLIEPTGALVVVGFSGHGFKFSSVVGEVMADQALDGGSRFDLSLFRLRWFDRRF